MGGGCLKARRSIRQVPLAATVASPKSDDPVARLGESQAGVTAAVARLGGAARNTAARRARICRSRAAGATGCSRARDGIVALGEATVAASGHAASAGCISPPLGHRLGYRLSYRRGCDRGVRGRSTLILTRAHTGY